MTEILSLDQALFHWINSGWQNEFFDSIIPYWREEKFWIPLYVFLVGFLILNFRRNGVLFILIVLATTGIADLTSSRIVKNSVQRVRPCNDKFVKDQMTLRVHCGTGYSFTSSHAANHFAVATILVLFLGKIWSWTTWILYIWAATIALSQVYVGVHYPLDVLSGAILGYLIARFVFSLCSRLHFNLVKAT